ncbi:MAG: 1-acyl-sn-glycerol-3-phosphate acyltransferase [Planctomycetes bacterium]|nr:1-acyl-sn-glycerol-3-phosphate acyltransferase [Planctomycetota bacterium]
MRLVFVALWTVLCTPLVLGPLAARCAGRIVSMRWGAWVCHVWARGLLRVLGVRFSAEGPTPPRGAFIASNHTSWLDILVLSAWTPTNFIAKKEVAKIPGIGLLSGLIGTQFLNRQSQRDAHRLASKLRSMLKEGLGITLFPEGYCADGHSLLPFRPALFGGAAELGTPCVPITITYDLPDVVWNDGTGIGSHAHRMLKARRLDRGGAPIQARIQVGPTMQSTDRKLLARTIEKEVRKRFRPFAPASKSVR